MFLRFSLVVLCCVISCNVFAQGPIYRGPNGQVLPTTNQPSQQWLGSGTGGIQPGHSVVPLAQPQGTFHNRIPGGWVSPNVVTGINNQTGGLNTSNSQVDDSAFAFGREQGKANKKWVRRPVYGANGQISGYQEGHVWTNPYTGQEHGETKSFTPNNLGGIGVHSQTRGFNKSTGGYHSQSHTYLNSTGGVYSPSRAYSARPKK